MGFRADMPSFVANVHRLIDSARSSASSVERRHYVGSCDGQAKLLVKTLEETTPDCPHSSFSVP